jgi:peptidoglycan/xylan/chitin deacetylase (PgdA/CDA1 family)
VSVLCYHAVEDGWPSPLAVEPALFDQHCAWLSRHRTVLPLETAVAAMDRHHRMPARTAALTFDDGFASLHSELLPRLRRWGLPATVFLVAQTLTPHGQEVDWVDTPPDHPMSTLTLDQVREMQEAGVDFQSHSWAHRDLTTLSYAECVTDLRDSRELLADLLGRPVTQLAYPRGRHDADVRRAAAEAGYSLAFALPERHEEPGPFAVPRVGIHRGNGTRVLSVKETRPYLRVRTSPVYDRARRAVWTARSLRRPVARR